jgi:hypothetical protein
MLQIGRILPKLPNPGRRWDALRRPDQQRDALLL